MDRHRLAHQWRKPRLAGVLFSGLSLVVRHQIERSSTAPAAIRCSASSSGTWMLVPSMFITDMRASGSVVMRTSIRALRCVLPLMTHAAGAGGGVDVDGHDLPPKQSRAARGSHGLFCLDHVRVASVVPAREKQTETLRYNMLDSRPACRCSCPDAGALPSVASEGNRHCLENHMKLKRHPRSGRSAWFWFRLPGPPIRSNCNPSWSAPAAGQAEP